MTEEKKDYGQTLNLPVTDFPMRGGLPTAEPKMQQWWNEIDIYSKVQENRNGKPKFILHDGPPYANGDIHIGHALNKIIKDFIVRFKTMQGYDAPYVPGWDTHGLPIEQAIANSGKVDRKKMSVTEFREACKEYALSWVERQKTQFERLGIRGDFSNPYVTLDPIYEAQQIRLFGDMVNKGYVYKGLRPVYWSPSSESALAEAEIEYKEKRSASIFVAFNVKDSKGVIPQDAAIVIWTTTPWTLPANLGISVNPEFDYAIVDVAGRKFVLAEGLLQSVAEQVGWESYHVIGKVKGEQLEYVTCQHPFYDRESLVMVGDHVTLDAGTGCVHTAPGHGEDDFQVGKRYNIGVLCPVDDQGKFTAEAPGFEGIFYEDANKQIGQMLEATGHLLKLSFITHQYAHDWRTKKPVIYRATEQWFASIDGFREAMLEEIKNVSWVPHWGEQRMHNMIAERGDWCISRQRTWGVPIPIFYCRSCNTPLVNEQTIEHVAGLFEQHGSNVWFDRAEADLLPVGSKCACGHSEFRKETDIMDVWFDSGSSHKSVLEARGALQFPADLYVEGFDQYRGWFNSSLITSTAVNGCAPYKQVISHGFALDGEGRKMSKSLGNTVDPTKVCNQLGADILRLWVASVDYGQDVRISDAILSQISEGYRKIRNTLRFFLGNLEGFNPATDMVAFDQMNELDRYAISGLHHLINRVTKAYDNYEFNVVYQSIHHYCAVDMSAFYLDITKDRLYASAPQEQGRKAAQTVLYHVLTALTRLVAPILPHTADEVWKFIPGETSLSAQLADMPNAADYPVDAELEQKWTKFAQVRDEIFKALEIARKDKVIGNALGAHVDIYPTAEVRATLAAFDNLEELLIISSGTVHLDDAHAPAESLALEGLKVLVTPATGEKCERCWMVLPEVGQVEAHPTLCRRCAAVVSEL